LKYYVSKWEQLTSDLKILDIVSNCHIEFEDVPTQKRWSLVHSIENKISPMEKTVIDTQIIDFVNKKIIKYSEQEEGQIISPIFLRPKPDGSHRVIFNLKGLNESVVYHHFKLDTLEATLPLVTPGCYMTSLDLKDAYYSVPIAPEHQKFLKFTWRGELYQYLCLPMGLTSSPRLFTKLLKPVFAHLRGECGISCAGYIDDSLYIGDSYGACIRNTLTAVQVLMSLGFHIHPKKSSIKPTQSIEYLGFVVSSTDMSVKLTEEKMNTIVNRCKDFLNGNKEHTIREVASLVGTIVSTFPGVQFGPLHYRHLEREKIEALKRCGGNYENKMMLSLNSLKELAWWINNLRESYRKITREEPSSIIEVDASLKGWGAKYNKQITNGVWSRSERDLHINCLELLAVLWGLTSLCINTRDIHLRVMSDNVTAVSYINEMGGCKSHECNRIAFKIWQWAIEKNIWLSAAHVPGIENQHADSLSRTLNPNLEWSVTDRVFNQICKCYPGKPSIDMFASRVNAKLPMYVSWKPDPFAVSIDAFTVNWAAHDFYAFPPFVLVGRCLQKIRIDGATGILIAPMWPTQTFFVSLLSMLVETPRYFQATKDTLTNQALGEDAKPLKTTLMVCKVSGNPLLCLEYRQKLPTSSCRHGERTQLSNTTRSLEGGKCFVYQDKLIQCVHLFQ